MRGFTTEHHVRAIFLLSTSQHNEAQGLFKYCLTPPPNHSPSVSDLLSAMSKKTETPRSCAMRVLAPLEEMG